MEEKSIVFLAKTLIQKVRKLNPGVEMEQDNVKLLNIVLSIDEIL